MTAHIRHRPALALCLLCLAWSPWLAARTIYQYVDQHGAMAFSDSPPEFTNDYVEIEVPDQPDPSPVAAEQTLDDMVEVTERLEARRQADEEARRQAAQEARERRRDGESRQRQTPEQDDRGSARYPDYLLPGYYGGVRPPRNPGYVNQIPDDPAIQRRHELRVPLRIPAFGTGENYRDRIAPYPEHNRR